MSDTPWLTIIGLGEDGPDGLNPSARQALDAAEIVMGPPRHLGLLPDLAGARVEWPVPFADGVPQLLNYRGRRVVVLASGDPFWFGAGAVLARELPTSEWQAIPASSVFSLAAARMGWPLETTQCIGLHAAPFARLRGDLAPGMRAIVLLRDGAAIGDFARWITEQGFGDSALMVMEALGGPRERVRQTTAAGFDLTDVSHPVCVGLSCAGAGRVLPLSSGRADDWFDNDGQITKRPVRALTLSALAPRRGEHLWDIGGGSGSIGIEWVLSGPTTRATAIEPQGARAGRIGANAARLGVEHRLQVVEGTAPEALAGLETPDAVFIGGGLSDEMLHAIWAQVPKGTRIVANAVTLEAEATLAKWHNDKGGDMLRIELAQSAPLGRKRGWKAAYPIVQWSVEI
ncbi:precorrin-6y C5,15-methyltransferase (decarboxylating) subunit CbiE [Arenibacterium sp. CAU 1754]